jgi:hypothetical protein
MNAVGQYCPSALECQCGVNDNFRCLDVWGHSTIAMDHRLESSLDRMPHVVPIVDLEGPIQESGRVSVTLPTGYGVPLG